MNNINDNQRPPIKDPTPKMLSLRIPKYLLTSITNNYAESDDKRSVESKLLLNLDYNDSRGGPHIKFKQSSKAGQQIQEFKSFSLQKEAPNEVYIKEDSSGHVSSKYQFRGYATTRYRVVDRDRLGERARATKELEQRKRKEIVRIDDTIASQKRKAIVVVDPKKNQELKRKKRNIKRHQELSCNDNNAKVNEMVDPWMPEIKDQDDERTIYDSIVRVYGVPKGYRLGDIKRFFAGLGVLKCFSCFPFPLLTPGLKDTNDKHLFTQTKAVFVPREAPSLRIFVQFASKYIAHLACSRSGEPCNYVDPSNGETLQAALRIEPIRKDVGNFLLNSGGIEIVTTEPIQSFVNRKVEGLAQLIKDIFQSMYLAEFSFDFSHSSKDIIQKIMLARTISTNIIKTNDEKKVIELYNFMCDVENALHEFTAEENWKSNILLIAQGWMTYQVEMMLRCRNVSKMYNYVTNMEK